MSKYEVEASFSYGITKPGEIPYSSENFRAGLTITEEVEADSEAEARDLGLGRLATFAQDAKLTVINEAGLTSAADENGVIFPVFGGATDAVASARVDVVEEAVSNVTPIGAAPTAQAEAETDSATSASVPMWDGRPIRIFDNRENKKSERSPDFRIQFLDAPEGASDDDKFKPFWVKNRDGTLNSAALKVQSMLG
jgi:hypothetical protein